MVFKCSRINLYFIQNKFLTSQNCLSSFTRENDRNEFIKYFVYFCVFKLSIFFSLKPTYIVKEINIIVIVMEIMIICKLKSFMLLLFLRLDIDECSQMTNNCNDNAACTNTIGSFSCACNSGFSGDGVTCSGKYRVSEKE